MSLDIWLECKCCKRSVDENNTCTYNLSTMWQKIYPDSEKFVFLDGMTGTESIATLEHAIKELESEPEKFRALNPANGCGSYEQFLEFLKRLLEQAREYGDKCVWQSWR